MTSQMSELEYEVFSFNGIVRQWQTHGHSPESKICFNWMGLFWTVRSDDIMRKRDRVVEAAKEVKGLVRWFYNSLTIRVSKFYFPFSFSLFSLYVRFVLKKIDMYFFPFFFFLFFFFWKIFWPLKKGHSFSAKIGPWSRNLYRRKSGFCHRECFRRKPC